MSIINDALKKTQKKMGSNTQADTEPVKTQPVLAKIKKNSFSHSLIINILLIIFASGLISFLIKNQPTSTPSSMNAERAIEPISQQIALIEPSINTQVSQPQNPVEPEPLSISGIMQMNGNKVVLLNNDVLAEGDKFRGMTIMEIHDKEIVCEKDGVQTIIPFK